jgi:maltose-binding protein MalE
MYLTMQATDSLCTALSLYPVIPMMHAVWRIFITANQTGGKGIHGNYNRNLTNVGSELGELEMDVTQRE